jgi:class 3 adenylate cyclase
MDVEGFSVHVFVSNNDGDVDATIILSRGPRVAYYAAPAKVTAERVTARFGSFGELDYRFAPQREGHVDCNGAEEGEAVPCCLSDARRAVPWFLALPLRVRMGIDTGPVVAGMIGRAKFTYDLLGGRREHGEPDGVPRVPRAIQVTERAYQRLRERYELCRRGTIEVKGRDR